MAIQTAMPERPIVDMVKWRLVLKSYVEIFLSRKL